MPKFIWKINIFSLFPLQRDLHFCDTGLQHVQITQEEFYLIHSCIWSAKRHIKEKAKKMENTEIGSDSQLVKIVISSLILNDFAQSEDLTHH